MERDCESELSKLNIEQNACIYHFGASVIHGQRSNILRLRLCETVIHDVHHFATLQNIGNYEIEPLIQRLDLADINDCLYYDYCLKEHIEFYTFDSDLEKIDRNKKVHCYNAEKNIWT